MTTQYFELIFADNVRPGDLEIIEPATPDRPGRIRLAAARTELVTANCLRVYSANGGQLIGIVDGQPTPPHDDNYELEERKEHGNGRNQTN